MSDEFKSPTLTSMKFGPVDRPEESSSVPMLVEMATDALKAFANYEQREPMSIATQLCRCTINGQPAIGIVVVTVGQPDKVEANIAYALKETIKNLP